jgi:hypothetical protein
MIINNNTNHNKNKLKTQLKIFGTCLGIFTTIIVLVCIAIPILLALAVYVYGHVLLWTPMHNRMSGNTAAHGRSIFKTIFIACLSEFATWGTLIIEGIIIWFILMSCGYLVIFANGDGSIDNWDKNKIKAFLRYLYVGGTCIMYIIIGLILGSVPRYFIWKDLYGWFAVIAFTSMPAIAVVHTSMVISAGVILWISQTTRYCYKVFNTKNTNDLEAGTINNEVGMVSAVADDTIYDKTINDEAYTSPDAVVGMDAVAIINDEIEDYNKYECKICRDNDIELIPSCGHGICKICCDKLAVGVLYTCPTCKKIDLKTNITKLYS